MRVSNLTVKSITTGKQVSLGDAQVELTTPRVSVWFEVNPWSDAPLAGERGELFDIVESPLPIVLEFNGGVRVAYRSEDVTLLCNKLYPY